jgi:hypothetical protein
MINTVRLFIALGKSTIKSNLDWGEAYDKLKGLKTDLNNQSQLPLVAETVSRDEFSKRFLNLSMIKYACMIALTFSIMRSFGDQPLFGMLSAIGASTIFFILTLQFAYRSWIAEFVWTNWDKRMRLKKPRFGKFLENLIKRPLIIFSFNLD